MKKVNIKNIYLFIYTNEILCRMLVDRDSCSLHARELLTEPEDVGKLHRLAVVDLIDHTNDAVPGDLGGEGLAELVSAPGALPEKLELHRLGVFVCQADPVDLRGGGADLLERLVYFFLVHKAKFHFL